MTQERLGAAPVQSLQTDRELFEAAALYDGWHKSMLARNGDEYQEFAAVVGWTFWQKGAAASQAREKVLRDALAVAANELEIRCAFGSADECRKALALEDTNGH